MVVVQEATEFQESFLTSPPGLYVTTSLLAGNTGMYVRDPGDEGLAQRDSAEGHFMGKQKSRVRG